MKLLLYMYTNEYENDYSVQMLDGQYFKKLNHIFTAIPKKNNLTVVIQKLWLLETVN